MKKFVSPIVYVVALTLSGAVLATQKEQPGLVPDEETAIAIARAVCKPLFRSSVIERYEPYVATLKEGVWHVHGTLPDGITRGGTPEAEVALSDGRIVRVGHGR